MSRGPHTFRQTDLERAIKAARKAGATHFRVEIADGKLNVIIGEMASPPIAPATDPALEKWLADED